ncbi:response regulator transcription factor [Polynucleobacter sinensis]|jgi:two-component system response regulator FixJ|uniref:response regulator transcription factor n=1 Tax=Polynucleobacter sinensis TaxID=1743157 RepID=UPI000783362F|nr:response regulator [Polynucleobacter sinensis]
MTLQSSCRFVPNESSHIFLIDDDDSVRLTLSAMLKFLGYQVHAFSSALEFLQQSVQAMPAVIITDMRMPEMTGVELQTELVKRGRQIPIIFISGQSNVPQTIRAMKQGAIEFLVKPFERDQLLAAITRGLEQDALYMRHYIEQTKLEVDLKNLAPHEREVFELLAVGFNDEQIQEKLQISLSTAEQYKSEVMRKLNLHSLAQLIALKNGQDFESQPLRH